MLRAVVASASLIITIRLLIVLKFFKFDLNFRFYDKLLWLEKIYEN